MNFGDACLVATEVETGASNSGWCIDKHSLTWRHYSEFLIAAANVHRVLYAWRIVCLDQGLRPVPVRHNGPRDLTPLLSECSQTVQPLVECCREIDVHCRGSRWAER